MPDTPDFPAYSQILLKQCVCYFNTVIVTADVCLWLITLSRYAVSQSESRHDRHF